MIPNTAMTAIAIPAFAPSLRSYSLSELLLLLDEEPVVVPAELAGQEPRYVFLLAVPLITTLFETTTAYWVFARLLQGAHWVLQLLGVQ